MVRRMGLCLLMLVITWPGMVVAQMVFSVQADKNTMVLGEALTLDIRAQAAASPLNALNLALLKQDFEVYAVFTRKQTETIKSREVTTQIMSLTLYPLRSGQLHLPVFEFMGQKSKPLAVLVSESGPQTPRVLIKSFFEPIHQRVRQAATLYLEVTDDGSLQWMPPKEILVSGMHVRPLAETQREEVVEGKNMTVHRYAWSVMPLREGIATVRFPMLAAVKFGTNLRYAASPIRTEVEPVPAYLPVHVPIGKLTVSMQALPEEILLNRPVNWEIIIQGAGVSEEGVAKLLSPLRGDASLQLYPLSIRADRNAFSTSPMQTLHVVIPFKPLHAGKLHMPDLAVPYYDPASGRLESLNIPGLAVEVVNPMRLLALKVTVALLLLLLTFVLGFVLWKKIRRVIKRNASLKRIATATTHQDLHKAMQAFDAGDGAMKSATLQNWLKLMEEEYGVNTRLKSMVQMLEATCYGNEGMEKSVPELAREIGKELKSLHSRKGVAKAKKKQNLAISLFNSKINT